MAIRSIYQGENVLEPSGAKKLMQHMSQQFRRAENATAESLSARETEVLHWWLAEGKSNRCIAAVLFVCEATVKYHVHAILKKLEAGNRTEAVFIYRSAGHYRSQNRSSVPPKR